jgi:hypothetical protein
VTCWPPTVEDTDEKDEGYVAPKRCCAKPASPGQVYNTDGEEHTECTEMGEKLVSNIIMLCFFSHATSGRKT